MTASQRFHGRRVIVTGASSGIGRELVAIFGEEGATIVGIDRSPYNGPVELTLIQADLSDTGQATRAFDDAVEVLGDVDILCNNAGIGSTTSVLDASLEEWESVFAVNVRAVFLGMKAVLPSMLRRASGVIVNTASVAGMVGVRDRASYCASKGAVIALTRQVAIQYAAHGIRCNCVCPGTVDSPWVQRLLAAAPDPAAHRSELVARQPLGRLGDPREIALAIAYLASDDAAFITGTELVIDGGIKAG